MQSIGISDGRVPDVNMTTDSIRINRPGRRYTGPNQARLNNRPSATGSGAWEPIDPEAYLQIDFDQVYHFSEIRTQGSPTGYKFMTRFFLMYTADGVQWRPAYRVKSS